MSLRLKTRINEAQTNKQDQYDMFQLSVWIHSMKPIEQYFLAIPFIALYNVFLSFKSIDEVVECSYSNES